MVLLLLLILKYSKNIFFNEEQKAADLQRGEVCKGRGSQRVELVVGQQQGAAPRRQEVQGREGGESAVPAVHHLAFWGAETGRGARGGWQQQRSQEAEDTEDCGRKE